MKFAIKTVIVLLLFVLCKSSFAQNINQKVESFYENFNNGNFKEALSNESELLEHARQYKDTNYLDFLLYVAVANRTIGSIKKANNVVDEGLENSNRLLGTDNWRTRRFIKFRADYYKFDADYSNANQLYLYLCNILLKKNDELYVELIPAISNTAFTYYMLGDMETAVSYYGLSIEYHRKSNFILPEIYGDDNLLLGRCYGVLNQDDEAIQAYDNAYQIYTKVYGEDNANTRTALFEIIRRLSWQNESTSDERAIELAQVYENSFGRPSDTLSQEFAQVLYHHANSMYSSVYSSEILSNTEIGLYSSKVEKDIEKLKNGRDLLLRSNKVLESLDLKNSSEYYYNILLLSSIFQSISDKNLVDLYSKKLMEIASDVYGENSFEALYSKINRIDVLTSLGRVKSAEKQMSDFIKQHNLKTLDLQLRREIIQVQIKIFKNSNKLEAAIQARKDYMDLLQSIYENRTNPYYILECHIIAQELYQFERPKDAFLYQLHILNTQEDIYGKNSNEYVRQLTAIVLYLIQEFSANGSFKAELETIFDEYLSIRNEFNIDPVLNNSLISDLQRFYELQGKNLEALIFEEKGNTLIDHQDEFAVGDEIMRRWKLAQNYSVAYRNDQADEILNGIFEEFTQIEIGTLGRLVLLKSYTAFVKPQKDIIEAIKMAEWAVEIYEDFTPEKNTFEFYMEALFRLYTLKKYIGQQKEADQILDKIHHLRTKFNEDNDPEYISHLHLYAISQFQNSDIENATKTFEKAIQLEQLYGNTLDPLYMNSLRRLAKIYVQQDREEEADKYFATFGAYEINRLKSEGRLVNEDDFTYLKFSTLNGYLDYLNYAVNRFQDNPNLLHDAVEKWFYFNDLGRRKGRIFRKAASAKGQLEEYLKLLQDYSDALQLPDHVLLSENIDLEQLMLNIKKFEMKLGSDQNTLDFDHSIERVREVLEKNENYVFVIPFAYRDFNKYQGAELETKPGVYSYLVGCLDQQNLKFEIIHNVEEIEDVIYSNYQFHYISKKDGYKSDFLTYETIVKPIEYFFEEKELTFFSPAGIYNEINIESIYNPQKSSFFVENFNISLKDIFEISEQQSIADVNQITLFGGIDYGDGSKIAKEFNDYYDENAIVGINTFELEGRMSITTVSEGLSAHENGIRELTEIRAIDGEKVDYTLHSHDYYLSIIRGPEGSTVTLSIYDPKANTMKDYKLERRAPFTAEPIEIFQYLPGSLSEIETISSIAKRNAIEVVLHTGKNASEKNLKAAKSPDILHIATHSFLSVPGDQDYVFSGVPDDRKILNPLLMNALALSGVNDFNFQKHTLNNENCFLNGFELSLVDLKNTQLVVLSSCESGKGPNGIGEGISGFKEGLIRAGAQNIILSSYKIDDNATRRFFENFYDKLLNEKKPVSSALRETKIQMINEGEYPVNWGAFKLY